MRRWSRLGDVVAFALLVVIALGLGIALHRLAVDDAFITYRYAYKLATGQGFAYNAGRPVLSTTAPLYALVLAAGARIWPDIPALANALSAFALAIAAVLLTFLGRREGSRAVGALAGLFLVAYPLLWLSLGLETAFFLALALGAILAYQSGHLFWMAVLLALATLTRGDGLILSGVIAAGYALRWLMPPTGGVSRDFRSPIKALGAVGVYVAVMLPLLLWLTWQFGSPLPVTLRAKVAQSELGVTGFYAHSTYLQGLGVLLRARLAQSPLVVLFVPAAVVGLIAMVRRARWVRLIVAWGAAHLAGYTLLGVTPYYWYYAPLVPALACLAALGIVDSARWCVDRLGIRKLASWGVGFGVLWGVALVFTLLRSDWAMVRALNGPVPLPDDPVSKVLPEAKVGVYEQAGRWLRDHTPPDALVGVTEVGVMGYYADRPMVDFLGLLEPEVAQALARGDLYWALLKYQPDYLALTAVSPLYAYDLRADPWFQAAYAPVQTFDDARFWGSPLTVYQRRVARTPLSDWSAGELPTGAMRLGVGFGGQIRLLGALTGQTTVRPAGILPLTLYWQAVGPIAEDYTVFVHLLGQYDRVIAQRDAAPGLGAQPTGQWAPGEMIADPYLLALPEAAYAPDQMVWEVGLYDTQTGQRLQAADGTDNVRFGAVTLQPAADPLHLNFGPAALTGYELNRLALRPGEALHVTLHWTGQGPVRVTMQLASETGEAAAQASGDLDQGVYTLILDASARPGAYDLEMLLVDPATEATLPLLGADGQPQGDRAQLTKVRLYP